GIAYVAVEPRHHHLLCRCDRRGCAQSLQCEAGEGVHEAWHTGQNKQDADTARHLGAKECWPKLPARHPPGNHACQDTRRDHEEQSGAQDGSGSLHPSVSPARLTAIIARVNRVGLSFVLPTVFLQDCGATALVEETGCHHTEGWQSRPASSLN